MSIVKISTTGDLTKVIVAIRKERNEEKYPDYLYLDYSATKRFLRGKQIEQKHMEHLESSYKKTLAATTGMSLTGIGLIPALITGGLSMSKMKLDDVHHEQRCNDPSHEDLYCYSTITRYYVREVDDGDTLVFKKRILYGRN